MAFPPEDLLNRPNNLVGMSFLMEFRPSLVDPSTVLTAQKSLWINYTFESGPVDPRPVSL